MRNGVGFLSVMFFSAVVCQGAEIFVPQDYPTIQEAVDAAAAGDTVIVADGTYSGNGNRNILIDKDLVIQSENGARKCIIDCRGSANDPASGFRLQDPPFFIRPIQEGSLIELPLQDPRLAGLPIIPFPVDKQVVIDGFTIQNGYSKYGGAVNISGRFKTRILNCRFANNTAYREESDGPELPPWVVCIGPKAGTGGAVQCPDNTALVNCIVEGGRAEKGGAIYCGPGTTIMQCTITGNQARQGGGIFYDVEKSTDDGVESRLVNSIVWDNRAQYGAQLALSGNLPASQGTQVPDELVPFPPGQQGNIVSTGRDLDLAIDGPDFFVLDNEEDTVFTRIGNFDLDEEGFLIDPETGRYVRRLAGAGEADGFQTPGDLRLRILPIEPFIPGQVTSILQFSGNLQASGTSYDATMNHLRSVRSFSRNGNSLNLNQVLVSDLDQFSGSLAGQPGRIHVSGTDRSGESVEAFILITEQTQMQDILDDLTGVFTQATATLDWDGHIRVTDNDSGYSRTWIEQFDYIPSDGGSDNFDTTGGFEYLSVGGQLTHSIETSICDSEINHFVLRGIFVRSMQINTWDFVVMEVNDYLGQPVADILHRRIADLRFNVDGSYQGTGDPEGTWIELHYRDGAEENQRIQMDFGEPGEFFGVTQFASPNSSVFVIAQDGYLAGQLASFCIDGIGMLKYTFTNGVQRIGGQIAAAVFENANSLQTIANDCYTANVRSGAAQIGMVQGYIVTQALEIRPPFTELKVIPFYVSHSVLQGGLKGVSFEDARAMRAIRWELGIEEDPGFYREGRWDYGRGNDSAFWRGGDYRLLPFSICIDGGRFWYDLPQRDFAGHERPFDFHEGAGRSFRPGIITFVPLYDLGMYEASCRQVEADVQIYPDTIDGNLSGEDLKHRQVFVMIRIPNSEFTRGIPPQKQTRLFTDTGLEPVRLFVFRAGRSEPICITGIFDYEDFLQSVRTVLPSTLSGSYIEYEQIFDFWIDAGDDTYLKARGQIRYTGPGAKMAYLSVSDRINGLIGP